MIERPERYIKEFAQSGADLINFHLEATKDPYSVIEAIRAQKKKVGITINPGTPAEELKPYLKLVDMVLIMTVNPGFGGQKLIPDCVDKITKIRRMAEEENLELDIEADGGVNAENVAAIVEAGANVIVAGSAIFKNDISGNVREFLKRMGG